MTAARRTRTAATGAALALTATLVGVAAAPAAAGSGTTTYDCAFPAPLGTLPVPMTTEVPDLPAVPAGSPVPAGALDPQFVVDAAGLTGVLDLVSGLSASGMALGVGDQAVPLQGFSFGALSGTDLPASATSGAFTAPAVPGSYDITAPDSFDILGMLGPTALTIPCATDAPAFLGTLTVAGDEPAVSESSTEASLAKKKIRQGRRAKVTVVVELSPVPLPGMGEVVIKKGRKSVGSGTLESGSVTIRTKAFTKPGRYRLTAKYLGEAPLVSGSKDRVVLRVLKKRRR